MRNHNMARVINVEEADEYYPWMARVLLLTQSVDTNNQRTVLNMFCTGTIISYDRPR